MTRDLTFAPGREVLVEIGQHFCGFVIKGFGLFFDVHVFVLAAHGAQLFGLAFNVGEGFFEVEIVGHGVLRIVLLLYGVLRRMIQLC